MNKEIEKLIQSQNKEQITKALALVKQKGSIKELALLLDLFVSTKDTDLELQLVELLSNVKIPEANTIIIDYIKRPLSGNKQQLLLQICWQSRLDFSAHLFLFVEIFIQSRFEGALEAFTLIEILLTDYSFDDTLKTKIIKTLKESVSESEKEKQLLTVELTKLF